MKPHNTDVILVLFSETEVNVMPLNKQNNRIRIGLAAKTLLKKIMDTPTQPSSFTTAYSPLGAGLFYDGFCWVECFTSITNAFHWLKGSEGSV